MTKSSFEQIRSNRYPMIEASPHLLSSVQTDRIMQLVLWALFPSGLASIFFFGLHSLLLYIIAVGSCLLAEFLWFKFRRQSRPKDYSAAITGVLLAMSLPASVPLWFPALGGVIGIIVAKELFGGIGRNLLNPALTGRAVLRLVFAKEMAVNVLPKPFFSTDGLAVVTSATPLMEVKAGGSLNSNQLLDSLTGLIAGKNGETTAILLLFGGLFLLYKGVITWEIPFCMIASIIVAALFIGKGELTFVFAHVFSGATMLGAFFMATDYSTSPTTSKGRIIYGICCGGFLMVWRTYSSMSEGLTFILLIMNCLVPLIDHLIIPKAYGVKK